jgi:hypothetical protein
MLSQAELPRQVFSVSFSLQTANLRVIWVQNPKNRLMPQQISKEDETRPLLTLRANAFSEKQLAEIALAIQNRWDVPTFVKMHEIVVIDEDIENERARQNLILHFREGFSTILSNLELANVFSLNKNSETKYSLEMIAGAILPKWMESIENADRVPKGVYECQHCGKWMRSELELSMHTKLHYLA